MLAFHQLLNVSEYILDSRCQWPACRSKFASKSSRKAIVAKAVFVRSALVSWPYKLCQVGHHDPVH